MSMEKAMLTLVILTGTGEFTLMGSLTCAKTVGKGSIRAHWYYECDQCDIRFDRKSQLDYHIERIHGEVVLNTSDVCNKEFYNQSRLYELPQQSLGDKAIFLRCLWKRLFSR